MTVYALHGYGAYQAENVSSARVATSRYARAARNGESTATVTTTGLGTRTVRRMTWKLPAASAKSRTASARQRPRTGAPLASTRIPFGVVIPTAKSETG